MEADSLACLVLNMALMYPQECGMNGHKLILRKMDNVQDFQQSWIKFIL